MGLSMITFYEPISPRLRLILIGLAMSTTLGLVYLLVPRVLALHYQSQGGMLLEQALRSVREIDPDTILCTLDPLTDQNSRSLVSQARERFQSALEYNHRLEQTYLQLGRTNCLLGSPETAVENYQVYTQLRPENPLGHLESGFAYEALGDQTSAIREWRKAELTSNEFFMAGEQAMETGDVHNSLTWYKRAIWLDPSWEKPWSRVAAIYISQENWEEAFQTYQEALKINADSRELWYGLGQLYESQEEWQLALDAYQMGLSAKGEQVGLSNLYFRIGRLLHYRISPIDYGGAWEAYQKAAQLSDYPVDYWQKAGTYYQRGFLLLSEERWKEALAEFQLALSLRPEHPGAMIGAAKAYWKTGDNDQAKQLLRELIDMDLSNKSAYRLLGDIYYSEGNLVMAKEKYDRVLEIDPKDQDVKDLLDTLNAVEASP